MSVKRESTYYTEILGDVHFVRLEVTPATSPRFRVNMVDRMEGALTELLRMKFWSANPFFPILSLILIFPESVLIFCVRRAWVCPVPHHIRISNPLTAPAGCQGAQEHSVLVRFAVLPFCRGIFLASLQITYRSDPSDIRILAATYEQC